MLSTKQKTLLRDLFDVLFHIQLSEGQLEIAGSIIFQKHKRVQAITPTQYGKSLIVGLAVLISAAIYQQKWTIISVSAEKASIIMNYIIDHIGDNVIFYSQLDIDHKNVTERLQAERSKKSITFNLGGGVEILSVDARNGKKNIEAAMGKGGKNLVLDESPLLDDVVYATVKRMLGGWGSDAFLFEIGNPFYRNHFHRTWNSKRYHKIFIDYEQALAEGRYTQAFIDEMKEEALFDILYACKFPDEDEIDAKGYRQLLTLEEIQTAQQEVGHDGDKKLGCDVGGGGDYNVYCLRSRMYASIAGSNRSNDTMTNVTEIEELMGAHSIPPHNIFIDDVGIGRGVSDRLKEKNYEVTPISAGGKPTDSTRFANVKAENYWALREWIKNGGKLEPSDKWHQLTWIKYKVNSDKVIKIEPKDELKKRTGKSPDFAESLMLTFGESYGVELLPTGYIS
jgi:hypothetical protein